jgi:hypothetical protein
MRDRYTPDLVFAGQAPPGMSRHALPLHHGRAPPRSRHTPSQQLAALTSAQNQNVKFLWLRDEFSSVT